MAKNKFFGKLPETNAEQPKVVETVTEAESAPKIAYSKSALSIYKDHNTNRFNLIRVTYDADSRQAGKVEIIDESPDRSFIQEKFKLLVVREIFENKENV